MQAPVTNALAGFLGLGNAGPTTGVFAEGDLLGGDLFSQLLTGFDTGTGQGQQNLPGNTNTVGDLLPNVQASLLAAQQINLPLVTEQDPSKLLAQEITPSDAKDLLADLDAGKFGDPNNNDMLQQLHDQLAEVAKGDEPKTVGDIVQAITTATKTDSKAAQVSAVQAGTLQRALAWFQVALKKSNDENQANANTAQTPTPAADPNLQSLQASHFRARSDADSSKEGEKEADEKPKTKIEIIPASQTILVPQWVASIAPEKPAVIQDADTDSDLPEIELPKIGGKVSSAADKLAEAKSDFAAQQLTATNASMQQAAVTHAADHAVFKEHLASASEAYSLADNSAAAGVDPVATASAVQTQTTHAPQAVSTVSLPPGVVNHAPVAEQVHVAITRAQKDNVDHITLQLEPAHLGRVEVQMHMGHDGQTQIIFTADKPETFDALSRDARALEASLQEAGIQADAGSMQFNLRQQPQPQAHADANFGNGRGGQSDQGNEIEAVKPGEIHASIAPASSAYTVNVQDGVDIHA